MMKCVIRWCLLLPILYTCSVPESEPTPSEAPTPTETDPLDNYTDWAIYRGDKKGNQYAELAQIHAANAHRLELAWQYRTGDANQRSSMQVNPIMVNGLAVLFYSHIACSSAKCCYRRRSLGI